MTTLETLTKVFRTVFDDPTLTIAPETTANEVDGWDSLSHVNLILAVENQFDIEFKQKEVVSFRNVGDLLACIERKLAQK